MSLPLPSPTKRHPLSSRPSSPSVDHDKASRGDLLSQAHDADAYLASQELSRSSPSASQWPAPRRRRTHGQDTASPNASISNVDDAYDPKGRSGAVSQLRKPHSTLRRIESLFGVDSQPEGRQATTTSSSPSSRRIASNPGTRLVLQHTVSATDTLQGVALRYKTDMQTLRRVNGMWPGDDVVSRKFLWVPLDRCNELATRADAKIGLQASDGQVTETTSSVYLGFESGMVTEGSRSSTSTPGSSVITPTVPSLSSRGPRAEAESSRASISELSEPLSSANKEESSIPVVRRLPSEVLGHFPAAPRSEVLAKGKEKAADQWDQEVVTARPNCRLGPGPGMSGYEPGSSGVDDLLQLARHARMSDSQDKAVLRNVHTSATGTEGTADLGRRIPFEACEPIKTSNLFAPKGSFGTTKAAQPWKPNLWKFGGSKISERSGRKSLECPDSAMQNGVQLFREVATNEERSPRLIERSIEEWQASSSNLSIAGSSNTAHDVERAPSTSYNGWNDIPTLQAYAKGRVVEAYGKGNKRRSAQARHRFLDDIAAGLPANAGPASKWARPIGEFVPLPRAPGSGATALLGPSNGTGSSLRAILSDTLRGHLAIDEALAKGFEEVLNRSEAWNTFSEEELEHARRLGVWPPAVGKQARLPSHRHTAAFSQNREKLSAEQARKTLGGDGPSPIAGSASLVHDVSNGSANQISGGAGCTGVGDDAARRKSLHEMADLQSDDRRVHRNPEIISSSRTPNRPPVLSSSLLLTPTAPPGQPMLRKKSSSSVLDGRHGQQNEGK